MKHCWKRLNTRLDYEINNLKNTLFAHPLKFLQCISVRSSEHHLYVCIACSCSRVSENRFIYIPLYIYTIILYECCLLWLQYTDTINGIELNISFRSFRPLQTACINKWCEPIASCEIRVSFLSEKNTTWIDWCGCKYRNK